MRPHRIVTLGAGTGQAVVLKGLAPYRHLELTAIVGVTDNGGHSGCLRRILGIPQVGDLRNCLSALTNARHPLSALLDFRFTQGALDGTQLGNLILAALIQHTGALSKAAGLLSCALNLDKRYRVFPVSNQSAQLCAKLADGRTLRGEWEIVTRKPHAGIVRLFHQPRLHSLPACQEAIRRADLLVLCPGSLLTGLASVLLTDGIRQAIHASCAKKVYVCNLMTQRGQTDRLSVFKHVALLSCFMNAAPNVVLVNTGKPAAALIRLYGRFGAQAVEDDADELHGSGVRVVRADLVERIGGEAVWLYHRAGKNFHVGPHYIRHDARKLGRALIRLISSTLHPIEL